MKAQRNRYASVLLDANTEFPANFCFFFSSFALYLAYPFIISGLGTVFAQGEIAENGQSKSKKKETKQKPNSNLHVFIWNKCTRRKCQKKTTKNKKETEIQELNEKQFALHQTNEWNVKFLLRSFIFSCYFHSNWFAFGQHGWKEVKNAKKEIQKKIIFFLLSFLVSLFPFPDQFRMQIYSLPFILVSFSLRTGSLQWRNSFWFQSNKSAKVKDVSETIANNKSKKIEKKMYIKHAWTRSFQWNLNVFDYSMCMCITNTWKNIPLLNINYEWVHTMNHISKRRKCDTNSFNSFSLS